MTDTWLAVFTGVLAFAILMQSILFLFMFLNLRRSGKELLSQIQKLTEKTEAALEAITNVAENIRPVARKLADSAEVIHARVVDIDGFLGEIVEKSRREIVVIEDALHDATNQIRYAINILSSSIIMPVSRISALTKAVSVAVGVLFRRRKKEADVNGASAAGSKDDTIHF